jgi:hypothetical protein
MTEHIPNRAELIVFHGHTGLELWNNHTNIVVNRFQRFQFQFALQEKGEGREGRGERKEKGERG